MYHKKYLKMTIRTARRGRAWAREEPTQLELIQSHLENRFEKNDVNLEIERYLTLLSSDLYDRVL